MVVVKAAALIEGVGLRPVGGRSSRAVSGTWPVCLTQRSGRTGTIGMYEAGSRGGPGRGGQIDPRRPPGPDHPPASDRTGRALLAAGPGPDAAGRVGSHPASARRAGIVDHGRGLGPYDVINVRLHAADAIVFLDFSPFRCAWRAIRRSPERADFWKSLLLYRRRSRPVLRQAIAAHAGDADLYVLPTPRGPAIHREDSLRHA